MANFKSLTRYTGGTAVKNRSEQDFLVLRQPLKLAEDEGDIFVTITKDLENRPDLVASKAYDNPDLWWAIYEFNGIRDPLFNLRAGQILRIPKVERVLEAISKLES